MIINISLSNLVTFNAPSGSYSLSQSVTVSFRTKMSFAIHPGFLLLLFSTDKLTIIQTNIQSERQTVRKKKKVCIMKQK